MQKALELLCIDHIIFNNAMAKHVNMASVCTSFFSISDLSDCNNYRGISLINIEFKIISKIVTDRISNYALSHNFIRREQFGFRNHKECIRLFITIREICQRRKFHRQIHLHCIF